MRNSWPLALWASIRGQPVTHCQRLPPQTPSYLLSQILRHCMASLCFAADTLRPNSLLVYTEALRAPMRTHTDSNNHLSTHCKQCRLHV